MNERLKIFEAKIEEYYLSCMPSIERMDDKYFLSEWPLYKFSISRLHAAISQHVAETVTGQIADKLIDIKLHYAYLLTVNEHFLRGATIIVGNNELEKLNPRTISALRGIHYRAYLLSVVFEQTLDLLHMALKNQISNFKKGKWGKIISITQEATGDKIISPEDAELIKLFKEKVRTAEMHKFSMIRALTGKEEWTHLQKEELAAGRILNKIYTYYINKLGPDRPIML